VIDTTTVVQLTPANLASHFFAFRNNGCQSVLSSGEPDITDPDGSGTTGTTIAKFSTGASANYNEVVARAAACTTGKVPLSTDVVSFPSSPTANATVTVTFFDNAGNSGTGTLSFPPCVASPDSTNTPGLVCWKPN
jgi:hypothetical protein